LFRPGDRALKTTLIQRLDVEAKGVTIFRVFGAKERGSMRCPEINLPGRPVGSTVPTIVGDNRNGSLQ
jgi:hypothetical protein